MSNDICAQLNSMIFVSQILAASGAWSLRLISHSLNHSSGRRSFQIIQTGDRIWGWIVNNEYSIKLTIIRCCQNHNQLNAECSSKAQSLKKCTNTGRKIKQTFQHYLIPWHTLPTIHTHFIWQFNSLTLIHGLCFYEGKTRLQILSVLSVS